MQQERAAARLRRELYEHVNTLHRVEDTLTEAQCAYKVAKIEWNLCCYQLRMLEVAVLLETAA